MPSLASLKKQAEKKAKEDAGKGSVKDKHIQGLILESDLVKIDTILIKELGFINANGDIIDYVDPPEVVDG